MKGRKTWQKVSETVENVPLEVCHLFVLYCLKCQTHGKSNITNLVVKPILSSGVNMRWQVDLIDMRTCSDSTSWRSMPVLLDLGVEDCTFNWTMNVQDHFSKFIWLFALIGKHAKYVAHELNQLIHTVSVHNLSPA